MISYDIFLLLSSLFNDAFGDLGYTESDDWIIMNNELESMWKEEVIAKF
jgi:hypothetical protein